MNSTLPIIDKKDILQVVHTSRQRLIFPHIFINGNARTVEAEGVPVQLTPSEFEILYLLAYSPGETLSASDIYRSVWQMEDLGNVAPVRAHMSNLRHKLWMACPEHEFIISKWKKGYQFLSN